MARKKKHEDHANHEAWAIPYGDLVTLLLAFFVVMYAISSVNEGKYRVLADALAEAFGAPPRTMAPIQVGDVMPRGSERNQGPPIATPAQRGAIVGPPTWQGSVAQQADRAATIRAEEQLKEISQRVEEALAELIEEDLVKIRRAPLWLEVEIRSDILFPSGSAVPQDDAVPTLQRLAAALGPFPNPLRIEGHTDNVPIHTRAFPSNWELSAARAASVVHLFGNSGIAPERLAVIGYGEFRPAADNATIEGRNGNRRVIIVVLAAENDRTNPADEPETGAGTGTPFPGIAPAPYLEVGGDPGPARHAGATRS
ncbi:MAG: flagellar motor protein MotD [Pseudomonadota bacterium]